MRKSWGSIHRCDVLGNKDSANVSSFNIIRNRISKSNQFFLFFFFSPGDDGRDEAS